MFKPGGVRGENTLGLLAKQTEKKGYMVVFRSINLLVVNS